MELEKLTFTLGARAWQSKHLDWNRALLYVEPIASGGALDRMLRGDGAGTPSVRRLANGALRLPVILVFSLVQL